MSESKIIYLNNDNKLNETPFYEKQWFKVLGRLLTTIIRRIPPLRRYISKTVPYLNGRVSKLYKEGKYLEAIELSLTGLLRCGTKNEMYHYWWWSYMGYASYCAFCLNNPQIMRKLISISEKGFKPFEGNRVSYCFCRFSNFMFTQRDYKAATMYAERAITADEASGEPHFLLGFYDLFINENSPVDNFSLAIKKDHSFLNQIIHHPAIKDFPNIIEELKNIHLAPREKSPNHAV